ncbi:hypothetical protein HNY73_002444 [Argiope bruennichi]|uniref:Uncharacterized protein n=1 Tax=Argiope bruennichi TaxID=94029 RepID=A0A8T0FW07_ARGBR|nr:hypothetical protein HNY73_002444 [Argiope bruennichi]
MKTAVVLVLCVLLIIHQNSVNAQRNRQSGGSRRGDTGGPSGVRFPTDDDDDRRVRYPPTNERGTSSGGLHAGKWPGGFYSGSKY